ncbi:MULTISPECIES: 3'-5' exonuclease [unclassified Cupriavidus]|uniref:3'-5' exonuclease n=1 Tax=unclassified Cupriavidus TaxID=2640874 RepID=UPI00313C4691
MNALIFDTETTGKKSPGLVEAAWIPMPYPGSIAELATQLVGNARAPGIAAHRFNPGKAIEYGAMATHHITNEEVAHCPPASTFRLPGTVSYLIGHKIDYDIGVIDAAAPGEGYGEIKGIDTLALAQRLWPECDSHTQSALLYFLMPEVAKSLSMRAHDAAVDVGINLRIANRIIQELQRRGALHPEGDWSFDDLWEISEIARVPELMPFGKHQGTPISEVPQSYWDWYFRQPDVDPYLERAYREGGRTWPWPNADDGQPVERVVSVVPTGVLQPDLPAQGTAFSRFSFSPRPRQ